MTPNGARSVAVVGSAAVAIVSVGRSVARDITSWNSRYLSVITAGIVPQIIGQWCSTSGSWKWRELNRHGCRYTRRWIAAIARLRVGLGGIVLSWICLGRIGLGDDVGRSRSWIAGGCCVALICVGLNLIRLRILGIRLGDISLLGIDRLSIALLRVGLLRIDRLGISSLRGGVRLGVIGGGRLGVRGIALRYAISWLSYSLRVVVNRLGIGLRVGNSLRVSSLGITCLRVIRRLGIGLGYLIPIRARHCRIMTSCWVTKGSSKLRGWHHRVWCTSRMDRGNLSRRWQGLATWNEAASYLVSILGLRGEDF